MSDVSDLQITTTRTSRFFALLLLKMAEAEIFALAEAVKKLEEPEETLPVTTSHFLDQRMEFSKLFPFQENITNPKLR